MLPSLKIIFTKILILGILVIPVIVSAKSIRFNNFKLMGDPSSYKVVTSVEFELTDYLRDALNNGVALKARVQFRLKQGQGWWFDKETTLLTVNYQLKYHALSQHYLLTRNDTNEHWNFSNLSSALRKLGELRQYSLPSILIHKETDYSLFAVADMTPETLRLPLRIQSLFSNKYRLTSEGVVWPLP